MTALARAHLGILTAIAAAALLAAAGCSGRPEEAPAPAGQPLPAARQASSTAALYGYRVLHRHPHDAGAFTQGLVYDGGVLYESTGLRGQSTLRRVTLESGAVQASVSLRPDVFGEGLALLDGRLCQLTLDSGVAYIYARDGLALLETRSVPPPGWGLCSDGRRLVLSDGSPVLRLLDPATLAAAGTLEVRDGDAPVSCLNELEWIEGEIWANVWKTDRIARIDPANGLVTGWVDLSGLHRSGPPADPDDVLNGIAWDQSARRLFVTGKRWDALYEIEVVRREAAAPSTPSAGGSGCLLP